MKKKILFVGLEVDDNAFHAAILSEDERLAEEIKCAPSSTAVLYTGTFWSVVNELS